MHGNVYLPYVLFFIFIVFNLFFFAIVHTLYQKVTEPICELIRVINLAKSGNYSEEIKIDNKSELFELGTTFISLISNLENIKQKINKRKIIELTTLHEISRAMSAVFDINEVLVLIVNLATEVLNAKNGSLMLIDKSTNELVIRAANGLPEEVIKSTRIPLGKGISGTVAMEGVPYLSQNIENDPRFRKTSDKRYDSKSFVSVPIKSKDQIIGVININNKNTGEIFTEEDLELLQILAHQAAISIENSRLYMQAERKIEEMELLFRASKAMSSILNVNSLLNQVLETCIQIVQSRAGLILLLDDTRDTLRTRTLHGDISPTATYDFKITTENENFARLEKLEPITLYENDLTDECFTKLVANLDFVPSSLLLLPLASKSSLTGALVVVNDETKYDFNESDINLLIALSSHWHRIISVQILVIN